MITIDRPSEHILQYIQYAVDRLEPSEIQAETKAWLRQNVVSHMRVYYMHDDFTFTRLYGNQDEVVAKAQEISTESPCGMLTSVIVMAGDKEQSRVGTSVHHFSSGFLPGALRQWREQTEYLFNQYPNTEQP